MAILITVLTILHVILCLLLILLILLQSGKGSDVGSMLGGGASQTLFGPAGAAGVVTPERTALAKAGKNVTPEAKSATVKTEKNPVTVVPTKLLPVKNSVTQEKKK